MLLENLNIHYFEYTKLYKSGKRFYITNNQNWLEYFIKNNLQDNMEQNNILWGTNANRYTLWTGLNSNQVLSAYYKHDMWNGIFTHHNSTEDSRDLFAFSSTVQNKNINNLYINNLDIINKIILIFQRDIYNKLPLENHKYLINTNNKSVLKTDSLSEISDEKINQFYDRTKIDRYYINQEKRDFYLTRMEFLCLMLLSHGKQIKDIARECSISPRTVESHINAIKTKSGCTQRGKLISILTDSQFSFSKDYIKYI